MPPFTNFFTAVNQRYEHFMPIYAYSVLTTNPDAIVEIAVEDTRRLREGDDRFVEVIEELFPGRFFVRPGDFDGVPPNSVRFLETPENRLPFTYIGDVDIVVLEHVTPWHLDKLSELELPHTNIVRPEKKRMSGLHFCQTDSHYPVDISLSRDKRNGYVADEHFLFRIHQENGTLPPIEHQERPQHGIHTSLNRFPLGSPGWGIGAEQKNRFNELFSSPSWHAIASRSPAATHWIIKALNLSIEATNIFTPQDIRKIRLLSG